MYDVAVIGGGAAGFFSALRAASLSCSVVILEKSSKLLSKVLVSGGGRCNVTHNCFDPAELIGAYPRGSRELLGPFTKFGPAETVDWFLQRGVKIKAEPDGRMFPVTDLSSTIVECFLKEAERLGVKIFTSFPVSEIKSAPYGWLINGSEGKEVQCSRLIIASGGFSGGKVPDFISSTGHPVVAPVPSLFTFNISNSNLEGLQGLSVPSARVRIPNTKFDFTGPLLITHWGFSGPVILKTSAWAARFAHESGYDFEILISFVSGVGEEDVRTLIKEQAASTPSKMVVNTPMFQLSSRLWERLCKICGIGDSARWGDLGKKSVASLVSVLLNAPYRVKGKTTFKEEFVTCGGIDLKSVNMKTMESRLHPGLFFAGEVLNIDGITGGFNFQAAWTTAWLAGTAAAGK